MSHRILNVAIILSCIFMTACTQKEIPVSVGLDVLLAEKSQLIDGKKVGIITNQTGVSASGMHIVDVLSQWPSVTIQAVYAPEHGFRGNQSDAAKVASYVDERTDVRVLSLYGRNLKPTPKMLEGVDVLIYDIQDVGARFYTFISTMGLAMEAAAENGIPFIVLDRPNPITGTILEGPILEEKHFSFVGKYPIPVRYGMTPGEFALMIKGEGWMQAMDDLDLTVVPLKGWRRDMWYEQTGLPWIKPSPNIPSNIIAALYPGMCLFEAVNISEARGTMRPFEQFGAPWIDKDKLADLMNDYALPGIYFRPVSYTPVSIPDAAMRCKYLGERVHGLELIITDREKLRPVQVMVYLFSTLRQYYPDQFAFRTNLERLIGISGFRTSIMNARQPQVVLGEWEQGIREFDQLRQKSLIS